LAALDVRGDRSGRGGNAIRVYAASAVEQIVVAATRKRRYHQAKLGKIVYRDLLRRLDGKGPLSFVEGRIEVGVGLQAAIVGGRVMYPPT
jgi:hypothetical protein